MQPLPPPLAALAPRALGVATEAACSGEHARAAYLILDHYVLLARGAVVVPALGEALAAALPRGGGGGEGRRGALAALGVLETCLRVAPDAAPHALDSALLAVAGTLADAADGGRGRNELVDAACACALARLCVHRADALPALMAAAGAGGGADPDGAVRALGRVLDGWLESVDSVLLLRQRVLCAAALLRLLAETAPARARAAEILAFATGVVLEQDARGGPAGGAPSTFGAQLDRVAPDPVGALSTRELLRECVCALRAAGGEVALQAVDGAILEQVARALQQPTVGQ
ncbi:hypothetical protein T492DRAFT_36684 [Pavlovales sp. CCMP2436]|nr:hypothetical protein T492DRAFT_36684 [Pavlovales sp. CCMP2436]